MRPFVLALLIVSLLLLLLSALGVAELLVWGLVAYVGAYLLERV